MSTSKPTLAEYLLKISPDFSVLDMVEKYAVNHNDTVSDEEWFQYTISDDKNKIIGKFERAVYRVYPSGTDDITISTSNNNCISISYDDSKVFVVYSKNAPEFSNTRCVVGVKF